MKFKNKVFIVALMLCLILSMGFITAQDNITDNSLKADAVKEDNMEHSIDDLSSVELSSENDLKLSFNASEDLKSQEVSKVGGVKINC